MPSIGTEETEHMAYNIEETQDIPYAAWLDSIPGFGRSRCYQLVETAGSARNAYEMPDSDIAFLLGAKAAAEPAYVSQPPVLVPQTLLPAWQLLILIPFRW